MRNSAKAWLPCTRVSTGVSPAICGSAGTRVPEVAPITTPSSTAPPGVASISLWRTENA